MKQEVKDLVEERLEEVVNYSLNAMREEFMDLANIGAECILGNNYDEDSDVFLEVKNIVMLGIMNAGFIQ